MNKKKLSIFIIAVLSISFILSMGLFQVKKSFNEIISIYENNESTVYQDKFGNIINIEPNKEGNYAFYWNSFPNDFIELLTTKEDKYFYHHFGINPVSSFRAFINLMRNDDNLANSTITQQLTKVLLKNENSRSYKNKLQEAYDAFLLEIFLDKDEIMDMYLNSVYFGNKVQGLYLASKFYYNTSPMNLSDAEMLELLVTIESPSTNNPFKDKGKEHAQKWAEKLHLKNYIPILETNSINPLDTGSFFLN